MGYVFALLNPVLRIRVKYLIVIYYYIHAADAAPLMMGSLLGCVGGEATGLQPSAELLPHLLLDCHH